MVVESVRVHMLSSQHVVILREADSERYLPIWIGPAEADAIAVRLQEVTVARPLTHDLLSNVIDELGGAVVSVVVNDLANDTFFARLHVEHGGRTVEIDSRPSDAIAIAVRAGVPIFAEESVLDRAGVLLDDEGQPVTSEAEATAGNAVTEEELEKLSAFTDFISELDLDDLDQPTKD